MSVSTKTNFVLDFSIFVVFLVAFEPTLTGLAIHEWLSLAFAAAIIAHLLFHWKWIVSVGGQFFKKLFHASRLNFLVDSLFFIAMTIAMFSGIMISRFIMPFFGISLPENSPWRFLHSMSADLSILLLGLHFALHWKWVLDTVKRYIISPVFSRQQAPQQFTPTSVKVKQD